MAMTRVKILGTWVTIPTIQGEKGEPGESFPDAPDDGRSYIRKYGEWVELSESEAQNLVIQRSSYLEFPNIGDVGKVYIDLSTKSLYYWDADEKKYFSTK